MRVKIRILEEAFVGHGNRSSGTEPDALCDRVRAAGAEITIDLHDTDYGSRDFGIRDPEGNRWYFGTYRGAPRAS